jgi:pseudouridine-5'-monophosphatase
VKLSRAVTHVIYDLDGVLLDTEPFYTIATREIVSEFGKTFDWSTKANMIGRPSMESARYLVAALELPISPAEYLERRRARLEELFPTAPAKEGAEAFTRSLDARGVKQAVGTSSEARLLDLKLTRHRQWFSIFSAQVAGDDPRISAGKPAPDIFLVAAADMEADPRECVVVEDSPAGVAAARAAGMQVVAIPDPAMDKSRFKDADIVVSRFTELEAGDLGL